MRKHELLEKKNKNKIEIEENENYLENELNKKISSFWHNVQFYSNLWSVNFLIGLIIDLILTKGQFLIGYIISIIISQSLKIARNIVGSSDLSELIKTKILKQSQINELKTENLIIDKVIEKNDIEVTKQFNTCDIMSITNLENERKELYDNLKDITKRKEILKYYSENNDKFYRFVKYIIAPLLSFGLIFLFTLIFKMPLGNRINLSILSFLNSIGTTFYRDSIDKKVIKSLYNDESISIKQCNAEILNLEYKLIPIMHKIVDTEYKIIKINELSNNDKTNINSKSTIISKIYSETSKELDMPNRSKIYKKYENI